MRLDIRDGASARLRGLFTITVTPFHADGSLNESALAEQLERMIGQGYDGVLIGGTYGEFATMDAAERAALFRCAAGVVGTRVPMMLCAAGSDPRVVQDLAALATELGGVPMIMPPYVSEVTDDQIVAFFAHICRSVPAAVIYNAPGVGITLSPALIERLADIDGIVGLKQGALAPATVDALVGRLSGRIRLFCASDLQMPGPLACGFDGLTSTNSCALPELIHASFHAFLGGDAREGGRLYRQWFAYRNFAAKAGQPQTVKAAMQLRGWNGGTVRRPLLALDAEQRQELAQIMHALASEKGLVPEKALAPGRTARDTAPAPHDNEALGHALEPAEPKQHPAALTA